VTRLDRALIEIRVLRRRIEAVEAAQAAVNGRAKETTSPAPQAPRPRYTTIRQAASDRRHNLWTEYFFLKQSEVTGKVYNRRRGEHPPTSKTWFAENVRVHGGERLSTREFQRWFQLHNTFAEDSAQDRRIRSAIEGEIARLRAAGYTISRVPGDGVNFPVSISRAAG
jgi:hypothetical protein